MFYLLIDDASHVAEPEKTGLDLDIPGKSSQGGGEVDFKLMPGYSPFGFPCKLCDFRSEKLIILNKHPEHAITLMVSLISVIYVATEQLTRVP